MEKLKGFDENRFQTEVINNHGQTYQMPVLSSSQVEDTINYKTVVALRLITPAILLLLIIADLFISHFFGL